MLAFVDER
jgi:hypothetical protein